MVSKLQKLKELHEMLHRQQVDLELLRAEPEIFLVIRLCKNKSLKQMANELGIFTSNLSEWENGLHMPSRRILERLPLNRLHIKKIPEFSVIEDRYKRFQKLAKGRWSDPLLAKQAREMALQGRSWQRAQEISHMGNKLKPRTDEEKRISTLLKNRGFKFEEQVAVIEPGKVEAGSAIVDFLVWHPNGSKIAIETSKFTSENPVSYERHAILLAHKAFRMKKYLRNLRLMAAIITEHQTVANRIRPVLSEVFDIVLINKLDDVPDEIEKMALGEGISNPIGLFEPSGVFVAREA